MSQLSWTLLDDFGHQYEIGLYHGDRSRHVLIHINKKPIVIDFNIDDTKQYGFYVGQELCEIKIEKDSNQFSYSFVTVKDIDTPLNLFRKKQNRKYIFYIVLISLISLLTIIGLSFWFNT